MNLKKAINYAKHRLTSNSQKGFGIHSPFVFDFITNVLNEKNHYYIYSQIDKIYKNKNERRFFSFFYRVVAYYNVKKVLIVGEDNTICDFLKICKNIDIERYNCIENISDLIKYDLIWVGEGTDFFTKDETMKDNVILFIEGYCNNCRCRKTIEKEKKLTINIDFFDFSITFARNNTQKQHYKLVF